jgi:tricorn protease
VAPPKNKITKMKKKIFATYTFILLFLGLFAQDTPLWMRYPAISPDGNSIVFSYQGDLYKVASNGGAAVPLTLHEAYDYEPVWSHNGQKIAFSSNRYGNHDVYVMPSMGGKAERLTYHSAGDHPTDFSADNQSIMFTSSRMDEAANQQYPSGLLSELYSIPVNGGMPKQMLTTPALQVKTSADGTVLVFHDRKGYEDTFRKHHTSSVARDIWKYDTKTETYTQLTKFDGEDRSPIFAPNQQDIYYLSEESGSYNIFKMNSTDSSNKTQLTKFENHPVRSLSASKDGQLSFHYNGEIYTMKEGEEPQKVAIQIVADARFNAEKIVSVNKDASEVALSSNGKEVAYVFRGEIFVSSVKKGTTKRITNTPEQERSVSFSPDGRSLLYAGERNGSWNLYSTSIAREEEKYFFNSTLLEEETILGTDAEEFQPAYSPDGKEVAFLEERTTLKVINLETKAVREIMAGNRNYSYSDGDQHYAWSPDSKWFLVQFNQEGQWISQVGLISADGGEIANLTQSGYNDSTPRWSRDGKRIVWFSDRDGMKNDASWGGEFDVYAMYLTQEAYDKYKLDEEEYELLTEEEKEEKKKEKKEESDEKEEKDEDEKVEPIVIELEDIEDRKVRLTRHSTRLSDAIISKDGEKLWYLARFEKGADLWEINLRTNETKLKTKLGAKSVGDLILDKKGENLFLLSNGTISKIDVKEGKKKGVGMKGEMVLNEVAERAYLFEHVWRQVVKKFYKKDLHNVKWDFYKTEYARFLPHINNNHDFAEMLSEMLGELNASHTGARFRDPMKNGDETAALGVFYDRSHSGKGLKIKEIMHKSPLEKSSSKITEGTVIEKIDGVEIRTNTNPYHLLNRKAKKNVLLALFDPATSKRWVETVKPISLGAEGELRYQRWVRNSRAIVEKASGGTVGYVHVRSMNDRSYRTVYEEVLGENHGKKALVVDTRFNGGGWLHDDLATFLMGKQYMSFVPRGQNLGNEPQFKWSKPSIVVMGESNYSDAHMFPYTYRALGVGKLVGMPVPGTGTAVWWERLQNGMVFGIPQVGMVGEDGKYLENQQLEPDIKVMNEPGKVSKGEDQQLKAAVEELLKK